MWFVYILKSEKLGRHYIGCTANLEKRLKDHNSGRTKSTKNYAPYGLIYKEEFITRSEAYKREKQIKRYKSGAAFKKLICN